MTFVDKVLAGKARPEDMDDYVQEWHENTSIIGDVPVSLHDWLGLSWEEYKRWVVDSDVIHEIIEERRHE